MLITIIKKKFFLIHGVFSSPKPRLWLLVLAIVGSLPYARAYESPVIRLVYNDKLIPHQQVLDSFKTNVKELDDSANFLDGYTDNTINKAPDIVFAMGSKAVKQALTQQDIENSAPMLVTMTLSEELLNHSANIGGVSIKARPNIQLAWHKQILPDAKRVGVLYDPKLNQSLIDELELSAKSLALKLIAVPVNSPKEIPSALKFLSREADSILAIPDKTIYSSKTAKAVLLFSYRNRIPFIGLSKAWVKAGAIYALDWDYKALGKQCADMAVAILSDKSINNLPLQYPSKETYLLNLRVAKHLKLKLNKDVIEGAFEVYN